MAFAHAVWRTAAVQQARTVPAWGGQCWAVAAGAASAVLPNWVTTGDHLVRTIGTGHWPVAGVDLVLLASTAGLAWLALTMQTHWEQVRGTRAPARGVIVALRVLGSVALLGSLLLCLRTDHASMASLVWVRALGACRRRVPDASYRT